MTTTSTAPPRWAVLGAWLVPLLILPSAIWRTSVVLRDDRGVLLAVRDGGWYLLLLGVLSLSLGLLTVGLVRPWGEVYPRWLPVLGGRAVAVRRIARIAVAGGVALIVLTGWTIFFNAVHPFRMPVLVGNDAERSAPDWTIMRLYLPMVLWGPLVIAIARDYRRRHQPVPEPRRAAAVRRGAVPP